MAAFAKAALLGLALPFFAPSGGVLFGGANVQAASFDCAKASSEDEGAVCADPTLSRLDERLADAYRQAIRAAGGERGAARQVALDFAADRHACGADRACIAAVSLGALATYGFLGARVESPPGGTDATALAAMTPPDAGSRTAANAADTGDGSLPRFVGQCVATSVEGVHPRLEGGDDAGSDAAFDSGTSIDLANGGHQVSYDREPALIASRPGDAVTMCLVITPRRCPPGDDRGYYYLVTNLRTKASWLLADSQHLCGGA